MTAAATGLDRVRAVQRGDLPVPGIARLLGFTLTRVEADDVEAVLVTRDDMTNPMGPGATLTATGSITHRGRRLATAEGRLVDERGKLVAHGTTSCMVFPEDQ